MSVRNLICWVAIIVTYGGMLVWVNTRPVSPDAASLEWLRSEPPEETGPGASPWGDEQPSAPGTPPAAPGQPPPPPPPRITKAAAGDVIRNSVFFEDADTLVGLLRPSIRIAAVRTELRNLPKGASRFAGLPDVPPDFQWPTLQGRPLNLLAQIRLSDITDLDADKQLPSSGWLCFFTEISTGPPPTGSGPPQRVRWKVVHFDADVNTLRRLEPPQPLEIPFSPCILHFRGEWTLPSPPEAKQVRFGDRSVYFYFDLCNALAGGHRQPTWHHLLGYGQGLLCDMRVLCAAGSQGLDPPNLASGDEPDEELATAAAEWVLLLQMDSDPDGPGWNLRPGQSFSYWIRRADLARRDFSAVWVTRACGPAPRLEEPEEDEEYDQDESQQPDAPTGLTE